tara:strand:+ start:129 stop:353 length:225 start_codon:yes stop_codon:yes gene_type:complete
MNAEEIYSEAGLTEDDRSRMPSYIEGEDEFYGSEAFGKLLDYFIDEIPYDIQKCRDGTPDDWILEKLGVFNEER